MRNRIRPSVLTIAVVGLAALAGPAAGQGRPVDLSAMILGPPAPPPVAAKELAGLPAVADAGTLTWNRVYTLAMQADARLAAEGRAETLDPRALDERARRLGAEGFADFRNAFRTASGRPFRDPGPAYLSILRHLQAIDDDGRHVALLERLSRLVKELIKGESGALDQSDVDIIEERIGRGRRARAAEVGVFRDELDRLKVDLGLAPGAPVVPDRRPLSAFGDIFDEFERWSVRRDRNLSELDRIAGRLPDIGDLIVAGRPILAAIEREPGGLEEALRDLVRLAIRDSERDRPARPPGPRNPGLELRVRSRARRLLRLRADYQEARRSYVLRVRMLDMAIERIFVPRGPAEFASIRSTSILGVLLAMGPIPEAQDRLVANWTSFRAERLALYRDLGTLPHDNWDAFHADLSATSKP